jgi:dTDP-4-dehydrorhamnose reductase
MSLVILGSNGMLGSMLYYIAKTKYNISAIALGRDEFNAAKGDISRLDNFVSENTCIINCIGAIPQKKYNTSEYTALNTTFPQALSIYCKERNISLIHISTNCVFAGDKDNCIETDTPNADDDYGKSKYMGEPPYGLTIRCSIIGPERHTFCGLLEWFLHRDDASEIHGYIDSFWNGLTTLELSHIIIEHFKGGVQTNKLHYYSQDSPSKYEILCYVAKKFQKDITIHKKENGIKYYTLSSSYNKPRRSVYEQIDELYRVFNDYKQFYNLK